MDVLNTKGKRLENLFYKSRPEAMEIINRYKGKEYLLNILEDNNYNYRKYMTAMNRGLQKLGNFERKGLGGKKIRDVLFTQITSYWARHTWAINCP